VTLSTDKDTIKCRFGGGYSEKTAIIEKNAGGTRSLVPPVEKPLLLEGI
jgi:hypothetical protein